MSQKKLSLINSAHGSETRNIINELIKLFNNMGYTYNESLQKAQDILAEAQQTNDMNESVQQQINILIAESGTSDSEVLQARIDVEGNEYPVLKERLDEKEQNFSAQLAQNASNITNIKKAFGATGNGVDSDVDAIIEATENSHIVGFPDGTYVIDRFLEFRNRKIKWVALGDNVTFLDTGKDIQFEIGLRKISNGIKFYKCDVLLDGIIHDNVVTGHGGVETTDLRYDELIPKIDFDSCENVELKDVGIAGTVGPHVLGALVDETISNPAYENMRASYFRIFNCGTVNVVNYEQLEGAGGGEFLGFNRCRKVNLIDGGHKKGDATTTFWSFAKIIECSKVLVDGLDIQSTSSGSLIDISGEHIVYENIVADYPNGKFLDITQEWSYANVESGTFEIRNSSINSETLAFNSLADGINLKPVDRVIIENVLFPKNLESSPSINLPVTRNIEIRNQKILNQYTPCSIALSTDYEYVFTDLIKHINLLYDNVEVLADEPQYSNIVLFETKGTTKIKDSLINMNHSNRLEFRDRVSDLNGMVADPTKKFVVENTTFKDSEIYIRANIVFDNCIFDNCIFNFSNYTFKPSIIFKNSEIIVRKDGSYKNEKLFNIYNAKKIIFDSSIVHGEHYNIVGYSLFSMNTNNNLQIATDMEVLEINNSTFDVVRLNDDDTKNPTTTPVLAFGETSVESQQPFIKNVKIDNVDVKGNHLFTLQPSLSSNKERMIVITNSNSLGNRFLRISSGEHDYSGYKFLFNSNNFGSDSVASGSLNYYETILTDTGAEVIFEGNYKL